MKRNNHPYIIKKSFGERLGEIIGYTLLIVGALAVLLLVAVLFKLGISYLLA